MRKPRQRRGGALVIALLTLMVVMLLAGSILRSLVASRRQSRQFAAAAQAAWLAESALDRARVRLAADSAYTGETWQVDLRGPDDSPQAGLAMIEILAPAGQPRRITAAAKVGEVAITRTMNVAPRN